MSDSGAGAAVALTAFAGFSYLIIESVVSFFVLGLALGVWLAVVLLLAIVVYVMRHPIQTPQGWLGFLIVGGTAVGAPFFAMYFWVLHRHTSGQLTGVGEEVGSLACFAALVVIVFWFIPSLYQWIEGTGHK